MKPNITQSHTYQRFDVLLPKVDVNVKDYDISSLLSKNSGLHLDSENIASNDYNELIEVIKSSSGELSYAIQHPPKSPLLSATLITALISTLCAATAAFFYNRLHWHFVNKRERRLKIAETLIELVAELRLDSVNYWMKNYSRKGAKDLFNEEMRIKSNLQVIDSSIEDYIQSLKKSERQSIEPKLKAFHGELYDIITGDDFESQARRTDRPKVMKISNKCVLFRVYMNSLKA